MSNYTKDNLIQIPPTAVPAGTLAMKVGDEIFTPGNIKISNTSDATATAEDIAEGKTAYIATGKVTGTATGGGKTTFSYPLAGSMNGEDTASYIQMKGYRIHAWDVGMSTPDAWNGNFEQATLLGEERQVLSFPTQSDEDFPDGKYMHWLEIPVDIYKIVQQSNWSMSFCFNIGETWNIYSHCVLFGSYKYGGFLVSVQFSPSAGIEVCLNNAKTAYQSITTGSWYYIKLERIDDSVHSYLIPNPTSELIGSLTEDSEYHIGTLAVPDSFGESYANDVLFAGYESESDYRVFKLAEVKITVG